MRIGSAALLAGFVLLLLNSAYLGATATPSLFYAVNVAWPTIPWKVFLAIGANCILVYLISQLFHSAIENKWRTITGADDIKEFIDAQAGGTAKFYRVSLAP